MAICSSSQNVCRLHLWKDKYNRRPENDREFTAKLAAFKHISHSCFVETDGQNHENHFLQVRAKRNKDSKGEDVTHGLSLGFKLARI